MAEPDLNIGGFFQGLLPEGLGKTGFLTILLVIGVAILILGILGTVTYFVWRYYKYDQRLVIWKKIGQQVIQIKIDKGGFVRQSKEGDYIFKTLKSRKMLPYPSIQAGPKLWWYFIREDGEWINFGIGDLDDQMKKAGARYVDFDMRMSRLAIGKNLKERLENQTFMQKYGQMIAMIIWVLIITVSLVVVLREFSSIASKLGDVTASVEKLLASAVDVSTRQTSGVVPAGE